MPRLGQYHHNARLSDDQVRKIREMYATGTVGYRILAKAMNCGFSTIRDIVNNKTRREPSQSQPR